ncbi:MAG: hypothetical protein DRJ37_05140 [Thermoprotei archaeon]|nr:MAG: hypothetical protein DRJ37_05140 [Thermoprotei archaeon]
MEWKLLRVEDYVLRKTIEKLLEEKLRDISKAEKNIMTSIAVEDYKNYLKVKLDLLGIGDADYYVYKELKSMFERPELFRKEIEEWLEAWLLKWRQRVKVVFKDEQEFEMKKKIDAETIDLWANLRIKKELQDLVIGSLIRNGEYCLTNAIAESIIKGELFKYYKYTGDKKKLSELLEKNPVILLKDVLRMVKIVSRNKGYLISIKLDDRIFSEYGEGKRRRFFFR